MDVFGDVVGATIVFLLILIRIPLVFLTLFLIVIQVICNLFTYAVNICTARYSSNMYLFADVVGSYTALGRLHGASRHIAPKSLRPW